MNPLISIIIPVYNVERLLTKCLDSVLAQTYTNFELLLINDGSKDTSGDICERYKDIDKRIRVFHQENSGVSSARNKGIDLANGEYVCFIDSDDWVDPNFLENFKFHEFNADIFIAVLKEDHQSIFGDISNYQDTIEGIREEFIKHKLYFCVPPWGKLFKRYILTDNKIRFNDDLTWGEDRLFYYSFLIYIKSMYFVNPSDSGYNYLKEDIYDPHRRLTTKQHSYKALVTLSEIMPNIIDKVSYYIGLPDEIKETMYNWSVFSSRYSALKSLFNTKLCDKYIGFKKEVYFWQNNNINYLCKGNSLIMKIVGNLLCVKNTLISYLLCWSLFKCYSLFECILVPKNLQRQ